MPVSDRSRKRAPFLCWIKPATRSAAQRQRVNRDLAPPVVRAFRANAIAWAGRHELAVAHQAHALANDLRFKRTRFRMSAVSPSQEATSFRGTPPVQRRRSNGGIVLGTKGPGGKEVYQGAGPRYVLNIVAGLPRLNCATHYSENEFCFKSAAPGGLECRSRLVTFADPVRATGPDGRRDPPVFGRRHGMKRIRRRRHDRTRRVSQTTESAADCTAEQTRNG